MKDSNREFYQTTTVITSLLLHLIIDQSSKQNLIKVQSNQSIELDSQNLSLFLYDFFTKSIRKDNFFKNINITNRADITDVIQTTSAASNTMNQSILF